MTGIALLGGCGDDPISSPPVATIEVTPAVSGLMIGQTLQLTAKLYDASGNVLADRPVTWTSSAPTQASVTSTGLVTGIAMSDSVVITATSEDKSARATIGVVMDIAGEWNFTEQIEVWWFIVGTPIQGVGTIAAICSDTGSNQFTQSGTEIGGTMSHVGECPGHPSPEVPWQSSDNTVLSIAVTNGHVSGSHITFSVGGGDCVYSGDLTGPPTPKMVGTYSCPFSGRIWLKGTWEATPGGAPVSSVDVRWDAHTVVGGAVQLLAVPRDASGHVLSRAVTWASDNPSVVAISQDGLVTAHNAGSARITATSETIAGSAAVTADPLSLRSVSAGAHGCGVTDGGAAYCWGWGGSGELGIGYRTFSNETLASLQTPRGVAGGHSFAAVGASGVHSCGITPAHDAYCWGDNAQGQLGDGSTTSSLVPVLVTGGHQFASVTVGYFHTCGLTTANRVYCWGNNDAGQLGRTGTSSEVPVLVGSDTLLFTTVRAGLYHNCAISPGQEAFCWGYNYSGQVGNGATGSVVTAPSAVQGGHSFVAVAAGYAHSCAIASDGAAYCWGAASLIGDGSFNGVSPLPRAVTGGPFATVETALSAGQENTCALTSAGAAYCWGHNSLGELGDGSTTDRTTPVRVTGGTFSSISVGAFVTCGVSSAAVALCWGDNADGRAGIIATESCTIDGVAYSCATTPRPIIGQPGVAAVSLRVARQARRPLPELALPMPGGGKGFAPVAPSFLPRSPR